MNSNDRKSRKGFALFIWLGVIALAAIALAPGVSQTVVVPDDVTRRELAPKNRLRLAFAANNAIYAIKDASTGELRGVAIDIGKELATRLGVPFEPVAFPAVSELMETTGKDKWDIATIAIEPDRAKVLEYSRAFMEAGATYLLPPGSTINSIAEADRPGVRISVAEKSAYDLVLSRILKNATVVRRRNVVAAIEAMQAGESDAAAGPRQTFLELQVKFPGARLLDDHFETNRIAIAVQKGQQAVGLAYVDRFLRETMESGWMQQSIERANLKGARIPRD